MAGSEYERTGGVAGAGVAFARRWRGYDRAAVDAQIAETREAVALRDTEIDELRARADDLEGEVATLRAHLADANDAAARASRSARVFDHIVQLARATARAIVAGAHDEAREILAAAKKAATEGDDGHGSTTPDAQRVETAVIDETGGPAPSGDRDVTADATDPTDGIGYGTVGADDPSPLFPDADDAVSFEQSNPADLFDLDESGDDWSDFADSEAGRAFFADEAVDERARRWMLAG